MPFVIAWPEKLKPDVYNEPVIQLDIHATALAAAGVKVEAEWKLDGVDLLPHLTREKPSPPHDVLLWRFGKQMAIRQGDYKLVRYDTAADVENTPKQGMQVTAAKLYHLKDDIGETKDLAAEMPDKVIELQMRWDAWNAELAEPLWGGGGRKARATTQPQGRRPRADRQPR